MSVFAIIANVVSSLTAWYCNYMYTENKLHDTVCMSLGNIHFQLNQLVA